MSKQANEIRKQIEALQAQLDKIEKPSRDLKFWKEELIAFQQATRSAQVMIKSFRKGIAEEEREIATYEKECARLKALIENAKKPKARK